MPTPSQESKHYDTTFENHLVRSHVSDEQFSSWLIMMGRDKDIWSGRFWARITAADGLLRVSGDFMPIVFAYGPQDPIKCLAWMGRHVETDDYVTEKAVIGTGAHVRIADPATAKADLNSMFSDLQDDPDPKMEEAIRAALSAEDVARMQEAFIRIYGDPYPVAGLGVRVSAAVILAHAAVRRLYSLVTNAA